ncbi:U4 U6.U5 tri-snRNP-associated protein [Coemansia brasiliensis]|uniref:U4 U6.U5 tri-snRNP-associated protein n=1 Tax=Coemansia brasiliensis TaxID=2650707 RepID=A0A9W8IBA9_9FUNG|nr:U4 U6.U5 tri-snRNP-associated protein [Coemansia brasiliensis]
MSLGKRGNAESGAEHAHSKQMKIDSTNQTLDSESEYEEEVMDETAAVYDQISDVYLDTINRSNLDFDFEQLCSVSLSTTNIYACLVCGKYYQGRGPKTHAYFHSINDDHHVFINLKSRQAYILPDNYKIDSKSLNDIKQVINPEYSRQSIDSLDTRERQAFDLQGKPYLPGFVGLNRIKSNSFMNVVIQLIAHVQPLRDMLLLLPSSKEDASKQPDVLLSKLSLLVRKIWHAQKFKAHVSPHELVQEIVSLSKKRFRLDREGDPYELLIWLLNSLHIHLGGTRKRNSSTVYQAFQGEMLVKTLQGKADSNNTERKMPFLALSLELPPKPLFTSTSLDDPAAGENEDDRADIPQVPLMTLLQRYNGSLQPEQTSVFQLTKLPRYIICHIKRFTKNEFAIEKNPTVVNFPVRNLPFGQLLPLDTREMHGRETTYDLVINICHVGEQLPQTTPSNDITQSDVTAETTGSGESPFMVYIRNEANGKWLMLHDLQVKPIMPQMLFLSDSYIQVWKRND